MNLLIGCRVTVDGIEGTLIDINYDKEGWENNEFIVLFPDNGVKAYFLYQVKFLGKDLQFIQQVGKSKIEREKFYLGVHRRFKLMNLEKDG